MGRKGRNLIPLEKNKRVIYLDTRVRERKLVFGEFFFGILGILCILYCLCIGLFIGFGTNFYFIWGVMGVFFLILSLLCAKPALRRKIPRILLRIFWICFGVGAALLIFVETLVLSRCGANAAPGADYVIILGAQWKTTGPSQVLKYRLDEAVLYLRENPDTRVIVSGGKGDNEPIAEAQGMFQYLVGAGIDEERILIEDASTNTYENLKFSGKFLDREKDRVVIVTNNFHVYRAEKLAGGQGYRKAEGLAARSYAAMQPNNLLREFFGVLKDFFMGNFTDVQQTKQAGKAD